MTHILDVASHLAEQMLETLGAMTLFVCIAAFVGAIAMKVVQAYARRSDV